MFEKLGKFEIKRVLGNGAMGEVYLGVDPSIGREVAIKTILPAAAQGGEAKAGQREQEARANGKGVRVVTGVRRAAAGNEAIGAAERGGEDHEGTHGKGQPRMTPREAA